MRKTKKHKMKGDNTMQIISTIVLLFILIVVGYPVIYVVSCSFSSAEALSTGRVFLWPVEFTLKGYEYVMHYKQVWIGFRNTILYTIAGASTTMFLTIASAYPLSRKDYPRRGFVVGVFVVAMMTSAGMIPTFVIKSKLGLVGSPLAVILAGAVGFRNVVILRTAFDSVPGELYDSAQVDGATHIQRLLQIALPLSKATISTLTLFSVVACWNEYFNSMIYLRDSNLFPLQLVLRDILTAAQSLDVSVASTAEMLEAAQNGAEQIRYALIVIATVPCLLFYMSVQKFFKKGVMIGAVKG